MFKEMRRSDRLLPQEDVKRILEEGEYGILSTVNKDGCAYGVPVNYVWDGERIYFHCAVNTGHKVENLRQNPNVCFTVVGTTELMPEKYGTKYESVIAFGKAEELFDQDKQRGLELMVDKYSAPFKEGGMKAIKSMFDQTAVYAIDAEHMTGKARRG